MNDEDLPPPFRQAQPSELIGEFVVQLPLEIPQEAPPSPVESTPLQPFLRRE